MEPHGAKAPGAQGAPMNTARLLIFLVTYALISMPSVPALRLTRPAVGLVGAVAMVTLGGLPLREAYGAIDLDVIVFLLGVMLLSGYLEVGGFFEWLAAQLSARFTTARMLLGAVVLASGLLSAFFMNDTICLVITPVVLAAIRRLRFRPLPFLLGIALAANVGSAMTVTGNPQNMLIGVSSGLTYKHFLRALALPSLGGLAIVYGMLLWLCRSDLSARDEVQSQSEAGPATVSIPFDRSLVTYGLTVFAGALAAWLTGHSLPLVAIGAAAILMLVARRDPAPALGKVEWPLLMFFAALFVVTQGVRSLPAVQWLDAEAVRQVTGARWRDAGVVSGTMLVLSNLVSNVPAVLLWIPVIPKLPHPAFLWPVMAMSSTFAGNFTLVGSMANLLVAERAQSQGVTMGFWNYLRVGVPVTLLSILWGVAMLVLTGP